jgi:hypothetical protein
VRHLEELAIDATSCYRDHSIDMEVGAATRKEDAPRLRRDWKHWLTTEESEAERFLAVGAPQEWEWALFVSSSNGTYDTGTRLRSVRADVHFGEGQQLQELHGHCHSPHRGVEVRILRPPMAHFHEHNLHCKGYRELPGYCHAETESKATTLDSHQRHK